jgi:hypothetical protein
MPLGAIMMVGGLIVFLIGASQVYYYKLTRKKMVTGGIYKVIRHPQYAALAVSGFGLLMLWPRYIVLLSYITMLFVYYFLARIEEAECKQKFGEGYAEYMKQTGMFLPVGIKLPARFRPMPDRRSGRYLLYLGVYVISLVIAVLLANQLRDWSLDQIYALYEDDAVTISVTALDEREIGTLLHLAIETPEVKQGLSNASDKTGIKYLNYIVPTDWSASEVPMNPVENIAAHHSYPANKKIDRYKIVFTQSHQRRENMTGKNILLNTAGRMPLLEVIIDLPLKEVVQIIAPVQDYRLDGVPLPLF